VKRINFRTAASADMRKVARETRAAWGEAQAYKYSRQLRDDIKSLTEFPLRFPAFESRPGLRRMNSGRHAVFYLVFDDRIEIVRVIHLASDFDRWL
jgi:toxin ParE1/3/4